MRVAWLAALLALPALAEDTARIASFSPAATRTLSDLGAAGQIVAATRWCTLSENHPANRSCDAFEPDLEALRQSGATLAVLPRLANPMLAGRIRSLGVRTHVLAPESPGSPEEDIAALAAITGQAERGVRLIEARRRCERPASGKRVLIVSENVCAGPDSYLAWVIRAAGAEPAIRSGSWPEWDLETAARAEPDVVLYLRNDGPLTPAADEQSLARWRASPGLRTTPAAQTGCIYHVKLTSDWLPASGLPAAVEQMARLLR